MLLHFNYYWGYTIDKIDYIEHICNYVLIPFGISGIPILYFKNKQTVFIA